MFTLIPSSKDWSIRDISRTVPPFFRQKQKQRSIQTVTPVFTLFRSLQVQPKQRLRQTAASGNQEKRGERRKREVKDSALDLSRMDVEEVSAFKTDMQPSSVVCQYLNI